MHISLASHARFLAAACGTAEAGVSPLAAAAAERHLHPACDSRAAYHTSKTSFRALRLTVCLEQGRARGGAGGARLVSDGNARREDEGQVEEAARHAVYHVEGLPKAVAIAVVV